MSAKNVVISLRDWARQRSVTPQEQYRLGPTDTYVHPYRFYNDIMPLFVDLQPDNELYPRIKYRHLYLLMKGGVLESSLFLHSSTKANLLIKDSFSNRQRIKEWATIPDRWRRKAWVNANILTIGCAGAWGILTERVNRLQKHLSLTGWDMLFRDNELDLCGYLKVGGLVDTGKLPLHLVQTAVRLCAIRLQEWLRTEHESEGMLNNKPLRFVYKTRFIMEVGQQKPWQMTLMLSAVRPGNVLLSGYKIKPEKKRTRKVKP